MDLNASYLNPDLDLDTRVDDLVSRMTLDEKISQMMHNAPPIERLGIPKYNWWNECLHGVARAGAATVFPQAIGLAATWNTDLINRVASAVGDEARAKHHEAARLGIRMSYTGLTCWSPTINIFRDPRWGRGQESYGEDPYLTSRMGVAYIKGLQDDHPRYLKTTACAKHYAVHSGPEADRHRFNAVVDEHDLWETYLPAFQAAVQEAKVEAVMGAYNRTNGEPCCASHRLLTEILREQWGFEGHVVSDCGGIYDIYKDHGVVETKAEAAALAVREGCDLECGAAFRALGEAVEQGLIDEATIDRALKRLMRARFRLGMFDPEEQNPYAQIPFEIVNSPEHRALALETARESIVLLKNRNRFLPLDRSKLKTIAVIGPNADDDYVLHGSYHGIALEPVTPRRGIEAKVAGEVEVLYARGCNVLTEADDFEQAVEAARRADVAVLVLGLSQEVEGEEGETEGAGDRTDLDLPAVQERLLRAVHATGTPVVLVLVNGGAVAVNWADEHVDAIVELWYPGEAGGTALADVLFGDYNPGGRLPITFYRSVEQLPPFEDYSMAGRTYRYMTDRPLYPFGHGLSYTDFAYGNLEVREVENGLEVRATVTNVGERAGDEVVQLYVSDLEASGPTPVRHLEGFRRIHLAPGESRQVVFPLAFNQLALITSTGERVLEPGWFEISVGGGQPGYSPNVVTTRFELTTSVKNL